MEQNKKHTNQDTVLDKILNPYMLAAFAAYIVLQILRALFI